MFLRIAFVLTFLAGLTVRGRADAPISLLQDAVENWLGERDHWAFTQRAVEYEDDGQHERLERFDPSRPGNARWQLLQIDGKEPTPEQRQKWADKKFKRRPRKIDTPLSDFFDFDRARVLAETPQQVRFDVPLRRDKNWLFPVDKVGVRVTINKQNRALEHLSAHVREPFKVLLGVARVTGGEVDVDFLHFNPSAPQPTAVQPSGVARVSVFKLGERVDFTWTDFKRVTPRRSQDQADVTEDILTDTLAVVETP